ncbi:hypothetical protein EON73_00415 [bacterium]|nr:MAG: hypothetical protein EON73_00415 [bacterium]
MYLFYPAQAFPNFCKRFELRFLQSFVRRYPKTKFIQKQSLSKTEGYPKPKVLEGRKHKLCMHRKR